MDKTHGNRYIHKEAEEKMVEALLGPDEDFLDQEHSAEFLVALGINPTTLISELKEHLEERARHHHAKTGGVPPSVDAALRAIRQRVRALASMSMDAASHIDLLLAGTLAAKPAGSFARSFRRENDEELCDEDQKLLDDLEAELDAED